MRLKRIAFSVLVAAIALLAATQYASAQKFQPKNIKFLGAPEYSDADLMAAAGLKKGMVLSVDDMKTHFNQLMSTGLFETLSFKFDGLDLIFSIKPSDSLYAVRLDNLPLIPGKDLDAKLHALFPLYHGKVPSEGGMLESLRGAFEQMLADQGTKASVIVMPYAASGSKVVTAMSYSINSTPVQVGAIHFDGVSAAMQSKAQAIADHTAKTPFDTENSQHNVETAFKDFYVEQGYAAVKVHATRSGSPAASASAIAVPYAVTVEEGRLYKLGAITLPPDSLVTQAEIDKITGAHGNGPALGVTLRKTWSMISSRYKSKGYMDCAVTPHPTFDETTGSVSYSVEITPGPVYHLAFIKFENVTDELRARLMRIWQMMPGDPFDDNYVTGFVARVMKEDPALQRTISTAKISYDVRANSETHEVNCVMRLEKWTPAP